jgi:Tfp pilus assembly protein PilN
MTFSATQFLLLLLMFFLVYVLEMWFFLRQMRGRQFALQLLETRISQLEQQIEALRHTAGTEAAPAVAEPQSAYQRAIVRAQAGIGAPDIAREFALSRGEAELIVAMHGPRHPV